ncbi:uncharacterized protein B0H18DRAFT_821162, partial [Fomitopsis serialis]|uniref:uncharacterized protein n=1 Tax=Fomitopsis serialis TaxID=139415 RepID=UPI00200834EC
QRMTDDTKRRCYQCLVEVEPARMRNHVGEHILKALRGVHEDLQGQHIALPELPCGFCGRPERLCVAPTMTKGTGGSSPQARSECPYYRLFFYQPSLKTSGTTPCTNVPFVCKIPGCKTEKEGNWTAIWKYNLREHMRVFHPTYSIDNAGLGLDALIPLPPAIIRDMYISDEEDKGLRIPDSHIP